MKKFIFSVFLFCIIIFANTCNVHAAGTAYLYPGYVLNGYFKNLANSSVPKQTSWANNFYDNWLKGYSDTKIKHINWVNTSFTSSTNLTYSGTAVYARLNGDTVELYTAADTVYTSPHFNLTFMNLQALKDLDFLKSKINMYYTIEMNNLFYGCKSLQNLDISNFNITNIGASSIYYPGTSSNWSLSVTSPIGGLLEECTSLKSVKMFDLSKTKLTSISYIFTNCTSLEDIIGIEDWDVSNFTDISGVVRGTAIESIDLSKWDVRNVVSAAGIFWNCKNLKSVNVSGWQLTKNFNSGAGLGHMFSGCESLVDVNLSNMNISGVHYIDTMFENCKSLKTLDLSGFNCSGLTYDTKWGINDFLAGCENLESVKFPSNWNTTNIACTRNMFKDCKKLKEIDLSGLTLNNGATDFSDMFTGCDSLIKLKSPKMVSTTKSITLPFYMTMDDDEDGWSEVGNNVLTIDSGVSHTYIRTYQIKFQPSGASVTVKPQYIYSNNLTCGREPTNIPSKAGYHFSWFKDSAYADQYNFADKVVADMTLYGKYILNDEKPYTVQYYLMDIGGEGYTQAEDEDVLSAVSGIWLTPTPKDIEGFTAEPDVDPVLILDDGSTVAKVYYSRNKYHITFVGDPEQSKDYWFDEEVTLHGTVPAGYDFKRFRSSQELNIINV